jgi:hypothetical protein
MMKVVLSGSQDWVIYLVMFALSAALHTGVVFVIFMTGPSAAIEGQLGDAGDGGTGPTVARMLLTWKSHLSSEEEAMRADLDARVHQVEGDASLDSAWTKENAGPKLQALATRVGAEVRSVAVEKADGGKVNFRLELRSQPATVLRDLALVTRIVGLATQKKTLSTDRLLIDVVDPSEKPAGQFDLSTQDSRDLAAGRMTLKELYQAGLKAQ